MTMFICNKQTSIGVNDNFSFGNGNFSIFLLGFHAIKKSCSRDFNHFNVLKIKSVLFIY